MRIASLLHLHVWQFSRGAVILVFSTSSSGPPSLYRRSGCNCKYLLIANCEFFYISQLLIDLANINVHVYYSTVRGRPSQLLDSQFGLT